MPPATFTVFVKPAAVFHEKSADPEALSLAPLATVSVAGRLSLVKSKVPVHWYSPFVSVTSIPAPR